MDFNDPLDSAGCAIGALDRKVIKDFWHRDKDEACKLAKSEAKRVGGVMPQDEGSCLMYLQRNLSLLLSDEINDRQRIGACYGCLCASLDGHDDMLMWAHYGDSGKGVCIVLDLDHLVKTMVGVATVRAVTYTDAIPVCDLSLIRSYPEDETLRTYLSKLLSTKSKAWEYEKECRLIADVKKNRVEKHFGEDGKVDRYITLPRDSVKQLIFGPCVDLVEIDKAIHVLKDIPELGNMTIAKARRNTHKFGLYCKL